MNVGQNYFPMINLYEKMRYVFENFRIDVDDGALT